MSISNRTPRTTLIAASLLLFAASALAATITGTVTDRTTGKPSAGDTIAVINTAQSMDEITQVTSDASGTFRVSAPDGGQILLHITHRGAEYFKSVPPNTSSVAIDVYDAAARIDGITGEAIVLRAETDPAGKILTVSENFFIKNGSTPPRTEFGGNTFDFYLPKGAEVTQSLASAPSGLPTNVKVVPIGSSNGNNDAATGHYAFTFPIRPGETRFQVIYTLPYTGKQPFSIKLTVPTGDVAVMLPKTMQFAPTSSFQPITPDASSQSYDAHSPAPSQPVVFAISGTGQLPQTPDEAPGSQSGSAQGSSGQSNGSPTSSQPVAGGQRPGGGLGVPDDPDGANDPWAKYKWGILGLLGLALAGGAGVMLKSGPAPELAGMTAEPPIDITAPTGTYASNLAAVPVANPVPATLANPVTGSIARPAAAPSSLLQALRDELFVLETDRLAGKLSDAQYAEHKAAFDVVLRRALSRVDPS